MDPLMGVRLVADRDALRAHTFAHVEEDVDAQSNQAGCCQLRLEVRDGFPSDFTLLIVQNDKNLGFMLKVLDWSIRWEESIPNKEDEVREGPELDYSAVTGALGVFT